MRISSSPASTSAFRFPVSSSHLSSVLVLVKTCPSIGGETTLLSGVSTGNYTTTMPPSYLYQLRDTLVSHRTSIHLSSEVCGGGLNEQPLKCSCGFRFYLIYRPIINAFPPTYLSLLILRNLILSLLSSSSPFILPFLYRNRDRREYLS
jgi:hypothetical protein